MRRLLLTGAALMAMGIPSASATYISGTVSFYPDAIVQGSGDTQTISFSPPGAEFLSAFISGDFLCWGRIPASACRTTAAPSRGSSSAPPRICSAV